SCPTAAMACSVTGFIDRASLACRKVDVALCRRMRSSLAYVCCLTTARPPQSRAQHDSQAKRPDEGSPNHGADALGCELIIGWTSTRGHALPAGAQGAANLHGL